MAKYNFSKNRIHDHVEKLGFDVRPIIEVKMEREKLWHFGQYLVDTYPQLFESLVTGISEFHVKKKLIFPGKGEIDFQTLTLTGRGLVFIFPRALCRLDVETELPEANDIVRECLKKFKEIFPDRAVLRAGKVNEYIFLCDDIPSKKLIAERFMKIDESSCEEIGLNVNLANDEFNRWIRIQAVSGVIQKRIREKTEQQPIFGVTVLVDFNNKDMSQPLEPERIASILRQADEYNESDLYKFLNGDE